jgi:omega-6 fatty acid desaturase (delta-12 desaturase)
VEDQETKSFNGHSNYGKLVDTYGNEFEIPNYSIKDIRKAIPVACYERSATKGWLSVLRDIFSVAATLYLAKKFVTPEYILLKSALVML